MPEVIEFPRYLMLLTPAKTAVASDNLAVTLSFKDVVEGEVNCYSRDFRMSKN